MTSALVLERFVPPRALVLERIGPDASVRSAAQAYQASFPMQFGPPGPAGAALAGYEHVQSVAVSMWTVNHNLGRWPAGVTIVTTGGVEVEAEVLHVSTAQLTISFATPFAGRARII